MHILGFPGTRWEGLCAEAERAITPWPVEPLIVATDLDPRAIEAAQRNAENAGVAGGIAFGVCDFADTPMPACGGVVVLNPGYGDRLGSVAELEPLYGRIGDFFKQRGQGYTGYVFTGNPALAKRVGLRSNQKIPFFNSEIECRLLGYRLYEGTIRAKWNTGKSSESLPEPV
jgi:23S rRNA (guanine2445-N2)-methyltransferase / 23S rRNA (guanine2069-N7)-methyltransferase